MLDYDFTRSAGGAIIVASFSRNLRHRPDGRHAQAGREQVAQIPSISIMALLGENLAAPMLFRRFYSRFLRLSALAANQELNRMRMISVATGDKSIQPLAL